MDSRHFFVQSLQRVVILALVLAAPLRCMAEAPPPPLPLDLVSASDLSNEQLSAVKKYGEYWVAVLAEPKSKPEEIETARVRLIQPLQGFNVSVTFRNAYSKIIVPPLQAIIDQKNGAIHASINAIIVLSQLGTDRAVTALLEHCNAQSEKRWQIRLQAAYCCRTLLRAETLDPKKVLDAAKRLRDAAKVEDNNLILRHHFAAIDAADHNPLPAPDRQALRKLFIETLNSVVDQLPKDKPSGLIDAITSAIALLGAKLRATQIVDSTEKKAIGQSVGPRLGQLLTHAAANWDAGHADVDLQKKFSLMLGVSEGFLPFIDGYVRGDGKSPQTKLRDAWNSGDKAKFDADVAQWVPVLTQPPYAK